MTEDPPPGRTPRRGPRTVVGAILFGLAVGVAASFGARLLLPARPYVASYARADYDKAIRRLAESNATYQRYDALRDAAKTSVYFGSLDDAKAYATELLETARTTEKTWNYGNAVHDGHEVLGLVALRRGHPDEAAKELLLAGETPGSPQADSFGPNMLLAKELLEHGDRVTVIAYFERCRRFWEMHRGRLDQWTKDVREGRTPDFGANLVF